MFGFTQWVEEAMKKQARNLPPEAYNQRRMDKSIPKGLLKKPGGMPPGQYKKAWEMARTLDMAQAAYQMYLDPEGLLKSTRYSQNLVEIEHDHEKAQKDYLRNIALTAKGFHYAKIPHPLMTHFMR